MANRNVIVVSESEYQRLTAGGQQRKRKSDYTKAQQDAYAAGRRVGFIGGLKKARKRSR